MSMTDCDGPTVAELAAIHAEMPLIKAQMNLNEIEIYFLTTERDLTELDVRRWRRARRRMTSAYRAFYGRAPQVAPDLVYAA